MDERLVDLLEKRSRAFEASISESSMVSSAALFNENEIRRVKMQLASKSKCDLRSINAFDALSPLIDTRIACCAAVLLALLRSPGSGWLFLGS